MHVSYNKLFKLLIDKGMKRTELRKMTGISPNTLTKLSNNEYVSMDVLVKICRILKCDIGDIVEIAKSLENEKFDFLVSGGEQI
jgi:putative transcriptional regulator